MRKRNVTLHCPHSTAIHPTAIVSPCFGVAVIAVASTLYCLPHFAMFVLHCTDFNFDFRFIIGALCGALHLSTAGGCARTPVDLSRVGAMGHCNETVILELSLEFLICCQIAINHTRLTLVQGSKLHRSRFNGSKLLSTQFQRL